MLTRDQILAFRPATRDVHVPEWNADVRISEWTVARRVAMIEVLRANTEAVEAYLADQKLPVEDRDNIAKVERYDAALVSILFNIVDDDNVQMFTMDDYAVFQGMAFRTTMTLFAAFSDLSTNVSADAIETEKKSSVTTPRNGSRTGSRSRSVRQSKN